MESNANFAAKQLTTFNNNLNNQILTDQHNGFKLFKKPPRAPNSTPIHRPKPKTEQDEVSFSFLREQAATNLKIGLKLSYLLVKYLPVLAYRC